MKKLIPFLALLISNSLWAQIPEDALRFSYFPQNGTARTLAIGGAMGSLGGDITATFVNPAGLGNYKSGEIVFTPGFFFNNNKVNFRNSNSSNNKNNFGLGPIGLVFGTPNRYNPGNSSAFSIAVTQTANFNNTVTYKGLNNQSSYSEQWSEEIANSNLAFDDILRQNSPYAYGSAQAVYTYLVDTIRQNGNIVLKTLPEYLLEQGKALQQQKIIDTRGGIYEIGLGFASNNHDKILIGGTLGIPIVNLQNTTTFRESDTSANLNNNFGSFEYVDNFKTSGAGVNLKLGIIYRPQERIRIGLAMHTPTYMFSMTDRRNSSLVTNSENYTLDGTISTNSKVFNNGQEGKSKYAMLTPWKFMVSGSYVFREIENVKRQRAFVTADIEYVTNGSAGFYSSNEAPTADDLKYFKDLRNVISNQYKGNFNFRVGGELKFNVFMARLGFAHYTNPYKDAALKANRTLLSGGIGYRNNGFFIDLTYVHSFNKDVDFAYRLQDKPNTFASINNQRGNIIASVGVKF